MGVAKGFIKRIQSEIRYRDLHNFAGRLQHAIHHYNVRIGDEDLDLKKPELSEEFYKECKEAIPLFDQAEGLFKIPKFLKEHPFIEELVLSSISDLKLKEYDKSEIQNFCYLAMSLSYCVGGRLIRKHFTPRIRNKFALFPKPFSEDMYKHHLSELSKSLIETDGNPPLQIKGRELVINLYETKYEDDDFDTIADSVINEARVK